MTSKEHPKRLMIAWMVRGLRQYLIICHSCGRPQMIVEYSNLGIWITFMEEVWKTAHAQTWEHSESARWIMESSDSKRRYLMSSDSNRSMVQTAWGIILEKSRRSIPTAIMSAL